MRARPVASHPHGGRLLPRGEFGNFAMSQIGPWASIERLAQCDDASFHALVMPLANMARLAYTATSGALGAACAPARSSHT